MRVTIEFDNEDENIAAVLGTLSSMLGGETVKPAKKPKPTTPVAGNPDKEPSVADIRAEATIVATVAAVEKAEAQALTLRADAPKEIVAMQQKPTDREAVGNGVLKACKPKEEGGLTRPVAVGILEKFRPSDLPKNEPLKLGKFPDTSLPKIAALILAEYRA